MLQDYNTVFVKKILKPGSYFLEADKGDCVARLATKKIGTNTEGVVWARRFGMCCSSSFFCSVDLKYVTDYCLMIPDQKEA